MLLVLLACAASARAAEVALIGVVGSGAVVVAVDGGEPRTIKVGQTRQGIRVVAIEGERATIEFEGKTRVLALGQHYRSPNTVAGGGQTITLAQGTGGHFTSDGSINGQSVRFMIDTGATVIALPGAEAKRIGLDYRSGRSVVSRTAGGAVQAFRITLASVRLGDIEVTNVEAVVIEEGLDIALLGMSFLSRVDMRQEGRTMTLIKRF